MKRIISIVIAAVLIMGAVVQTPIKTKAAEGTTWLSQSDVDYFTEKFMYTLSESEKALKIEEINNLNPDLEWNDTNWDTVKEMSDKLLGYLSKGSKLFPNSIGKSNICKLGKSSLGYLSSLIEICKNIRYINETDTNNLEKAYHGIKIFNTACKTMGLTRDPSVATLTAALDILGETLMIGDVLYKQYIKEDLAFYEMDLQMAYYTGEELPTTPSVQRAFLDLLGEDNFYEGCSALYLKYALMRIGGSIGDEPKAYDQSDMYQFANEGDCWVMDPNAEVDQVRFAYNTYQMPMSARFVTTTYTLRVGTFPRNASIGSGIAYYYSSDTSIVTIDSQTGGMRAVSPGSATVYARSNNGVEGSCRIIVLPYRVNKKNGGYEITEHIPVSGENKIWIPGHINETPVIGIAVDAFSSCSSKEFVIPNTIVTIGRRAFCWCRNLQSITIPDSVMTIEESAFFNCSNLEEVSLSEGVETIGETAFRQCTKLTGITLPKTLKSLGKDVFGNCSDLKYIHVEDGNPYYYSIDGVLYDKATDTLLQYPVGKTDTHFSVPDSAKKIADYAFCYANHLQSVTIPGSVKTLGKYAFGYCDNLSEVSIGYGTNGIGDYAFDNCGALTSISIPNTVSNIGTASFECCSSLTNISLPTGLKRISDSMFTYCDSLEEITVPEGVQSIDRAAFSDCANLKHIVIPKSVSAIVRPNFVRCPKLETIEVSDMNQSFCDVEGVLYNKQMAELIRYPSNKGDSVFAIPGGVSKIGSYAFQSNQKLSAVLLPDSVNTIQASAFNGCQNLTEIIIPNGVTEIDEMAFCRCSNLKKVRFPKNLVKLGRSAFEGCSSLKYVKLPDSVRTVGDYCFQDCTNLIWADLPDGVTYIGYYAFLYCSNLQKIKLAPGIENNGQIMLGCTNLTSVRIPDGVQKIGYGSFDRCDHLTTVGIPLSVTEVGDWAFSQCGNIKDVYYEGTENDWNNIKFNLDNNCLKNATVHFNQTLPIGSYDAFFYSGDANLDSRININDVTAIQRHVAEIEFLNDEKCIMADTNNDGIININDATYLQYYLAEYDVVLG